MWTNSKKLKHQFSTEDDFSESYQRIQQLKTPDTQDTDVNDLLPLALTNFIRGRVKIFCSRKACPISDAIPTIEQLSIFNPTYLALFVPQASQSIMLYVVHQEACWTLSASNLGDC